MPSHSCDWSCRQKKHCPHAGTNEAMTLSPALSRCTSEPTARTVPVPSWPRISGVPIGTFPSYALRSEWQTPLASTWMCTLVGPSGPRVMSSMTSGSLYSVSTAAFMAFPSLAGRRSGRRWALRPGDGTHWHPRATTGGGPARWRTTPCGKNHGGRYRGATVTDDHADGAPSTGTRRAGDHQEAVLAALAANFRDRDRQARRVRVHRCGVTPRRGHPLRRRHRQPGPPHARHPPGAARAVGDPSVRVCPRALLLGVRRLDGAVHRRWAVRALRGGGEAPQPPRAVVARMGDRDPARRHRVRGPLAAHCGAPRPRAQGRRIVDGVHPALEGSGAPGGAAGGHRRTDRARLRARRRVALGRDRQLPVRRPRQPGHRHPARGDRARSSRWR